MPLLFLLQSSNSRSTCIALYANMWTGAFTGLVLILKYGKRDCQTFCHILFTTADKKSIHTPPSLCFHRLRIFGHEMCSILFGCGGLKWWVWFVYLSSSIREQTVNKLVDSFMKISFFFCGTYVFMWDIYFLVYLGFMLFERFSDIMLSNTSTGSVILRFQIFLHYLYGYAKLLCKLWLRKD